MWGFFYLFFFVVVAAVVDPQDRHVYHTTSHFPVSALPITL